MILLDANILIYAYVEDLPQHRVVSEWLQTYLSESIETVGVTWTSTNAFLRISTNKKIFASPWDIADATDRVDELLSHPMVQTVGPTDDHWEIYSRILKEMNLRGDIVMDAHIAAMAVENQASVASVDKDFRRFSDHVKIIDPLAK
ncbi:MAG: TA system VapC family ribonuclease toxin [Pyrinomonadaceae bacterium]